MVPCSVKNLFLKDMVFKKKKKKTFQQSTQHLKEGVSPEHTM